MLQRLDCQLVIWKLQLIFSQKTVITFTEQPQNSVQPSITEIAQGVWDSQKKKKKRDRKKKG